MRQNHLSLIAVVAVAAWLPAQDVVRAAFVRSNMSLGHGVWLRHCGLDADRRLVVVRVGDREAGCVIAVRDVLDGRRVGDDTVVLACVTVAGGGCLLQLRLADDGIETMATASLGDRRPAMFASGGGRMVFLAEDRVLWHAAAPPIGLPAPDAWQVLAGPDRIGERADRYGTAAVFLTPGAVVLRLDMAAKLEFPLPEAAAVEPASEMPREPRPLQFAACGRAGSPWSVPGVRVYRLQSPATVCEGSAGMPAWSRVRVGQGARFAHTEVVALVSWSPRPEPLLVTIGGHAWLAPLRMVHGDATASWSETNLDVAALVPVPRGVAAVGGFVHVQFAVLDADGAPIGATDVCTTRIAAAATAR